MVDKIVEKYYTPEIEEFHIGFEYEEFYDGEYIKCTYVDQKNKLELLLQYLKPRVKYLDKEDIESLGFEHESGKLRFGAFQIYNKDNISLIHRKDSNTITIFTRDLSINDQYNQIAKDPYKVNNIKIKNKSELKKLLKQLNILK